MNTRGANQDGLDVVVIGAGVIGLACAVALLHSGHRVRVIDRDRPGAGASYGNAGSISVGSVAPNAHPHLLLSLPWLLLDPTSPLSIRLRYLPKSYAWLTKRFNASRNTRVLADTARGLAPLMRNSIAGYRDLLSSGSYERLIRVRGKLLVSTRPPSKRESVSIRLRRDHGVALRLLTAVDIRDLEPALSDAFQSGVFIEQDGHTVDTMGLVTALADEVIQNGGYIENGEAINFDSESSSALEVVTKTASIRCDRAIIATGAWSSDLVRGLGDHVALESERGYHVTLPDPDVQLSRPVGHMDKHFYVTTLDTGLRVAGTAEIAGLEMPPNFRRAEALMRQAGDMLPRLNISQPSYWMGHRPATPDALPVIDRSSSDPRVIYAFGHGHLGLTLAPGTAQLVTSLINDTQSSFNAHPYRVSRFH